MFGVGMGEFLGLIVLGLFLVGPVIKESHDHWLPMLIPVGDGVMVATKI